MKKKFNRCYTKFTFTKYPYDHMLNMVQQKSPAPTVSTCNTNSTIGKNTFDPDHNQAWIIYKGATNHIVSTLDMIMEG